jgi:integrase
MLTTFPPVDRHHPGPDGDKQRTFYRNSGVDHLALQVSQNKRGIERKFIWEGWRNGRSDRFDLKATTLDDARMEAAALNPTDAPAAPKMAKTLKDAVNDWKNTKSPGWRPGTLRKYEEQIKVIPTEWLTKPVAKFNCEMIEHFYTDFVHAHGKAAAVTWIGVMRGVFNHAMLRKWFPATEKNPATVSRKGGLAGIQAFKIDPREVDLTDAQVAALDRAIGANKNWRFRDFYRLLRILGLRMEELLYMKWTASPASVVKPKCSGFVDLPSATMAIYGAFRKNHKMLKLLLPPAAMEIIRTLPTRSKGDDPSEYLFSSPFTFENPMGKPSNRIWHREMRRASIPDDFVPHGLRHLFVIDMCDAGVPHQDVADLIGDTIEVVEAFHRRKGNLGAQERAHELREIADARRARAITAPTGAIETTARPIGGAATVAEPLAIEDYNDDDDVACI